MKLRFVLSLGVCLSTLVFTNIGRAQESSLSTAVTASSTISYQGVIANQNGSSLSDGTYQFTVTFYADANGQTPLWSDQLPATVSHGVFNLNLGSGAALPSSKEMDKPLWIGIRVDGQAEMRPLSRFSAVPYAMNVSDGAITASKMGTDYVGAISVDGKKVTAKGGTLNLKGVNGIDLKYDEASNSVVLLPSSTGGKGKNPTWIGMINTNNDAGAPNGTEPTNTIGGGDFNTITAMNLWGTIGGGYSNTVSGNKAAIIGGEKNAANGDWSVVGGGRGNQANNTLSSVLGGETNVAGGQWSTVGGGQNNTASGDWSTVAGGDNNMATNTEATVGGGTSNVAAGLDATVAGGLTNNAIADHTFIGGGQGNNTGGPFSTIGGGRNNQLPAPEGVIAGGVDHMINAPNGTIGGGRHNTIFPPEGTISGGVDNTLHPTANDATIGGGMINNAHGPWSTISGGSDHTIHPPGDHATIGGGMHNEIHGPWSTISGGSDNLVNPAGDHATIGGGITNMVDGQFSTIGGGRNNQLPAPEATIAGGVDNVGGPNSAIGGGMTNQAMGPFSTIAGGRQNNVGGPESIIGGGINNFIGGPQGVIGGGESNQVHGPLSGVLGGAVNVVPGGFSVIGGGSSNVNGGDHSFIGGGRGNNIAGAALAVIGGGIVNNVTAGGISATIVGGDNLTSNKYAQVVGGFYNDPRNNNPFGPPVTVTKTNAFNDPLFMLGNGVAGTPANAFEVSYNGHSVVTDINNTGAVRGAVRGGTYQDNVVYAWGEIPAATGPYPQAITPNFDFGVAGITATAPGVYVITMNLMEPDGVTPFALLGGSVTATLSGNQCNAEIYATPPVGNVFTIYTKQSVIMPGPALGCKDVSLPFMFKVTGRP